MNLSNKDRELIERTLDEMFQRISVSDTAAVDLYCKAISIVRELPEGRKLRADFNTRRPVPQQALTI